MAGLTVAAVQLGDRPCPDFAAYAAHMEELAARAAGADLAVFPEYCTLSLLKPSRGVGRAQLRRLYDDVFFAATDRYIELFAGLASRHQMSILAGTHWTEERGQAVNAAHVFDASGRHRRFPKSRPTVGEEAMGLTQAASSSPVEVAGVRTGILVCYDVEFPELARAHALAGAADLLLVPSLTLNERGYQRVQLSARTRAVENQLYVVVSTNQTSVDIPVEKPVHGTGRAGVFGPIDNQTHLADGVLAQAGDDGDQVLCVRLDLDVLRRSREESEAPLRRHHRLSAGGGHGS